MAADPVPFSDMPACTVKSIRHAYWVHSFRFTCFSIRQDIWYVTNSPDMPTGKAPLPWVCKTCQLPSWAPSLIYIKFPSDKSVASLGCYKDDVCNSIISKISILHANPWSLPVSGKIFLYFFVINCHFGGHFVCILISLFW